MSITKRLYYFVKQPNFGDLLNENIFRKLSNIEVQPSKPKDCEVVAIGSLLESFLVSPREITKLIMNRFKPRVLVWGTGFIKEEAGRQFYFRRLDVRAVRGYYSLERLKSSNAVLLANEVAVADPGLLASMLIDTNHIEKKYALGIIPHYVDADSPLLNKITVKNSIVLDITQRPEILLKQIAECENIISSAMHGLIVADSLGIPNVRMILGNKITGGNYKFNDYYSAFNISSHNVINLKERSFTDDDLQSINQNYTITREQVKTLQRSLLKSFPYFKNGSPLC